MTILTSSGGVNLSSFKFTRARHFGVNSGVNCHLETGGESQNLKKAEENIMAPEVGLEPTTTRLTAACSTIELLWNPIREGAHFTNRLTHRQSLLPKPNDVSHPRASFWAIKRNFSGKHGSTTSASGRICVTRPSRRCRIYSGFFRLLVTTFANHAGEKHQRYSARGSALVYQG